MTANYYALNPISERNKFPTHFSLKCEGNSMIPTLHSEDRLYFKKIEFTKIRDDDFIAVKIKNKIITHRVVYKSRKYLITKGDNVMASDGEIFPHQVLGKLYKIKRRGRIIRPDQLNFLQSTLYFQEIVILKNNLMKNGVNFVFLKGLPVHLYYEGTFPKRIYADCDILIERKYYNKAVELLRKLKYKHLDRSLSKYLKRSKEEEIQVEFYKLIYKFPVVFDVHFSIDISIVHQPGLGVLYPSGLTYKLTNLFLEEKCFVNIKGETFPFLSHVNMTLFLALHFFRHNYKGMYRLSLLNRITQKMAFVKLKHIIRDFRLQTFVYFSFLLLKKYYKTDLINSLLLSIKPRCFYQKILIVALMKEDPYDELGRIEAGIRRFLYLFVLSPNRFLYKILVFIHPRVIFSIFWVIYTKVKGI